jgi:hypothetical protein
VAGSHAERAERTITTLILLAVVLLASLLIASMVGPTR